MNKIIIAIILAGFGAQLIKLILIWFKHKTLNFHDLVVTGGMPSSHSAFVVSLATIIYLVEGPSSTFAVSLVLAFIVIRDAFGVRRTVGEEGKFITKLLHKVHMKVSTHFSQGHTPLEVLVGCLVGFIISVWVYYLL